MQGNLWMEQSTATGNLFCEMRRVTQFDLSMPHHRGMGRDGLYGFIAGQKGRPGRPSNKEDAQRGPSRAGKRSESPAQNRHGRFSPSHQGVEGRQAPVRGTNGNLAPG